MICDRLEELENHDHAEEASHECRAEPHSSNIRSQSCLLSSNEDITDSRTSEQPVDTHCPSSHVPLSRCEPDEVSMCAGLCKTPSTGEHEVILSTESHSIIDSSPPNNHQSNTNNLTDVLKDVVINSMQQAPDSSDQERCPSDSSHENIAVSSISEPDLSLVSDLNPSLDSGIGDISSAETESKTFSVESETVCAESGKEDTCYNGSSAQTEAFAANTDIDCAVMANQNMSAADSVDESDSVVSSAAATITNSDVSKSSEKSVVRSILTASLSEVTGPAEETITHIGSTHIHVTDELSIINGVVQPVKSPVKIGEVFTLRYIKCLRLLVGYQKGHPARKNQSAEVLAWYLSGAKCK